MESAGFAYRHSAGIDKFLDGPDAKARDAVHVLFANEKVFPDDLVAAPDVSESENIQNHRTLKLDEADRSSPACDISKVGRHNRRGCLYTHNQIQNTRIGPPITCWIDKICGWP